MVSGVDTHARDRFGGQARGAGRGGDVRGWDGADGAVGGGGDTADARPHVNGASGCPIVSGRRCHGCHGLCHGYWYGPSGMFSAGLVAVTGVTAVFSDCLNEWKKGEWGRATFLFFARLLENACDTRDSGTRRRSFVFFAPRAVTVAVTPSASTIEPR